MRIHHHLVSVLSVAALSAAAGQVAPRAATARAVTVEPGMAYRLDSPRAVIGVSTSTNSGARDTLGLLVSSVTRNSPAEKAGIEEGNRIASINGVNLRLAAVDLGDPDMAGLMGRRLTRELDKVKPGDDVDLKVYGGGQTRPLKVKTVSPESLYQSRNIVNQNWDDRATLGIGIGSSGSKRDTLGVFVMSVEEDGPAAKAGIEEGQRIASINGVDVRVSRDDAGDDVVSTARVNRLGREMSKVKVGDAVELRVYAGGQTKTVKVTAAAWSSLKSHDHMLTIIRDGGTVTRVGRPPDLALDINGEAIGTTVRRAIEKAQTVTGDRLQDVGRVLDEFGRTLSGTIRWEPEADPMVGHIVYKPTPSSPAVILGRTIIKM